MNYELEGNLHKIYEIESKTESFRTREFVVTTDGNYPQYVKFQLTQDKVTAIDGMKESDRVKVTFDLRGREWQGKYFTNLNAWKVDKLDGSAVIDAPSGNSNRNEPPTFPVFEPQSESNATSDFDDLPF
jgi:hypothetical protein